MPSLSHTPAAGHATATAIVRTGVLICELTPSDRDRLVRHFTSLGEEGRFLRFGQMMSDDMIARYITNLDFSRDSIFGVYDDNLALVGVAHLALLPEGQNGRLAEFGVSVSASARGMGIGTHLFERAAIHSRNKGIDTLYMHCLSRNARMMRIAKRAGMEIHYAYGEAEAYLTLPPANTGSMLNEMLQQQAATFDYALKRQMRNARRLRDAWRLPQQAA